MLVSLIDLKVFALTFGLVGHFQVSVLSYESYGDIML